MFLLMSGPSPVVKADCPGEPGMTCGNGDVNGSGTVDLADAVYILQYFLAGGSQVAPTDYACGNRLPATGQTGCYTGVSPWKEVDCNDLDNPGQDGFYLAGCPMEGRFVDNGDGTVTDNCTGLIWQQATGDTSGDQQITGDDEVSWQEAPQYCENLELAGHDDWRLPNVRELLSLVDYGLRDPAIASVFSANSSWYWSSTSGSSHPVHAWCVDFNYGYVNVDYKHVQLHRVLNVRAVRGGL